jgi:DNA-binding NarL/FixJ family response regulator
VGSPITVAIVEDQPTARDGLAMLVDGTPGFTVIGRFSSVEDAGPEVRRLEPDVLLLDIGLPGVSGIEGARRFRADMPDVQILMLTVFADSAHVFEALCAGANGYLLKDTPPDKLLEAIRDVHEGGAPMSPSIARSVLQTFRLSPGPAASEEAKLSAREREVLGWLAEGYSYHAAAGQLGISIDTVRAHVRKIYEKLHVHTRSEAVLKAMRRGLLR